MVEDVAETDVENHQQEGGLEMGFRIWFRKFTCQKKKEILWFWWDLHQQKQQDIEAVELQMLD